MSKTQQLSYDEPWPMYSDEDEPWKDLERLMKLDEKMDTQKEMGAALGCTPSTISYWLNKAQDEVEPEVDEEDLHCYHYDACGNLTPRINNSVCIVCIDLGRHNQSQQPHGLDMKDFENEASYMEALYDEYSELAEKQQATYDERHSDDEEDDGEDSKSES
jgi:hypothetical protein